MTKEPKLWERSGRGWFVTVGRRQIAVGKDAEAARKQYHRILAGEGFVEPDGDMKMSSLISIFLDHSEKTNTPTTAKWHHFFLDSFSARYGHLKVNELKRLHITNWTQEKRKRTWGQNTVRHAMSCVRSCLRHGVSEQYIKEEPIKLKVPSAIRREKTLSKTEVSFLFQHAGKGGFREILTALIESGARPIEVCSIDACHVDLEKGIWTITNHKTARKTGKSRIIYLSTTLLELSRDLMAKHPTGALFRNMWGNRWTTDCIRNRFKNLKKKGLASDAVPYCLRNGFVTDALENGVPIATVAELVGHSDTRMITKFYSHLSERTTHLRNAVEQAVKR